MATRGLRTATRVGRGAGISRCSGVCSLTAASRWATADVRAGQEIIAARPAPIECLRSALAIEFADELFRGAATPCGDETVTGDGLGGTCQPDAGRAPAPPGTLHGGKHFGRRLHE